MTEYKRWLPIILFSVFLFILYNLNRFYKTENFDYSPFSLSGSGIQIKFHQDECNDDPSWISKDDNITCNTLTSGSAGCYFSDVNGFTGFDKCPRSCGNCQDQLFPGDSPNNTMLSAPDALYDNESGEMLGQVTQDAMNIGNSTMATFSDKRLYEIEERFEERLNSMEESISELLQNVYDDILLTIEEQSGRDATCLKNFDTNLNRKMVSELTDDEKTSLLPNGCNDLHLDGYGAMYCDTVENCLTCGDPDSDCNSEFNLNIDTIPPESNCAYNKLTGRNEDGMPITDENVGRAECCTGDNFNSENKDVGSCFYDGSNLTYNSCCFTNYELKFPQSAGEIIDGTRQSIPSESLNVNLNNVQEYKNIHNLEKCINNSNTEEFEVFKWIPSDVVQDDDNQLPPLPKANTDINRNLGIMLPLNFTTNCYELKDMEKYFGPELTDYSCKNQIFTKSENRGEIQWKNLYERCPIRCNENCRNLFNPSLTESGAITLLNGDSDELNPLYDNDTYFTIISNEKNTENDEIDTRNIIEDIKTYLTNIKKDDNQS